VAACGSGGERRVWNAAGADGSDAPRFAKGGRKAAAGTAARVRPRLQDLKKRPAGSGGLCVAELENVFRLLI